MTKGDKLHSVEQKARGLVLDVAKTQVGETLLTSKFGQRALILGRQAIRSGYEKSIPTGRLEDWTPEVLSAESVRRGAIQKPKELQKLVEILSERKPHNILEIGTGLGGTVFALCHVAPPKARIVSIALPKSRFGDSYSGKGRKKIETYAGDSQQISLIQNDSHDNSTKERVREALDGEQLDFLFIDGEHTLTGVSQDFSDYSSFVKDEGLIAVHDIIRNPLNPTCDVYRFWEDVSAHFTHTEIIDPESGSWGGIGVIEWNNISSGNSDVQCLADDRLAI
jgi:predicted O-methyltransferase YrrM